MNSRRLQTCGWTLILGIAVLAGAARADDLANAARGIVSSNKEAVVTIKLVLESRYSMQGGGSQTDESKTEITGTVIDPSGLVVVSLFTTDPTSAMGDMGSEDVGFSIDIKSADILSPGGDEIPAEIVLRDKDLDLAFLRPKEKVSEPFAALDLSKAGQPGQLDPVVAISRLGRVANREHGALLDRIEAVVEKPRMFYVPAGGGMNRSSLGAPVFALDGNVAGILVLRTIRSAGGGMGMMGADDNIVMIILPAADVLEVAKQAPEHAPESESDTQEQSAPAGEAASEG